MKSYVNFIGSTFDFAWRSAPTCLAKELITITIYDGQVINDYLTIISTIASFPSLYAEVSEGDANELV